MRDREKAARGKIEEIFPRVALSPLSRFSYTRARNYSQLSPCGHPAITDKIQIPDERGLTGNASRYYGLSL